MMAAGHGDDGGAALVGGGDVVGGVADDDGVHAGERVLVLAAGAALGDWDEGRPVGGVVGVGADFEV